MSYWILPQSGIPISVSTVQRLTNNERNTDEMKDRMIQYDKKLKLLFEVQSATIVHVKDDIKSRNVIDPYDEDPEFVKDFTRVIDDTALPHIEDINEVEVVSDPYVGMELSLARSSDGEMIRAKVRKRLLDDEGKPLGTAHSNPLLDSRKYEVEYSDGNVDGLTANIIAENMMAQVDEEGRRQMMLGEILIIACHLMRFLILRENMSIPMVWNARK
jgi:hypothetical protein